MKGGREGFLEEVTSSWILKAEESGKESGGRRGHLGQNKEYERLKARVGQSIFGGTAWDSPCLELGFGAGVEEMGLVSIYKGIFTSTPAFQVTLLATESPPIHAT